MSSLFLFLCIFLSLISLIQAKGTKPPKDFTCHSWDKPKRIDVSIETGSEDWSGTDNGVRFLIRDSQGVMCSMRDLDNRGNDHERNSIDEYAVCCPEDFAKDKNSLSLVLLGHAECSKQGCKNWFIERIKVHWKNFVLFEYYFHEWTEGATLFGFSRVSNSTSNNKTLYSRISV